MMNACIATLPCLTDSSSQRRPRPTSAEALSQGPTTTRGNACSYLLALALAKIAAPERVTHILVLIQQQGVPPRSCGIWLLRVCACRTSSRLSLLCLCISLSTVSVRPRRPGARGGAALRGRKGRGGAPELLLGKKCHHSIPFDKEDYAIFQHQQMPPPLALI